MIEEGTGRMSGKGCDIGPVPGPVPYFRSRFRRRTVPTDPEGTVLQKGQSDVGATAAILDLSLSLISIISTLSDLSLISEEVGGPPAVASGWRQFKIQAENVLMDRGLGCFSRVRKQGG